MLHPPAQGFFPANRLQTSYITSMVDGKLRVMLVVGSLNKNSATRAVLTHLSQDLLKLGCAIDILDLMKEPLDLFNPDSAYGSAVYAGVQLRVEAADVIVLGTPDYHGSISSVLKNFLDHFWTEFAGKLFATIVASHEKGLTVTDQLRTVARQCYAWSMPYGVSFSDRQDLQDNVVHSPALFQRLEMLAQDIVHYGPLLAIRREQDLAAATPGFMARYRPKAS